MIKWLLEIVYASILKRKLSTSFRCALRFVRRDYTTQLEIDNLLEWIEDHSERKTNNDRRSD